MVTLKNPLRDLIGKNFYLHTYKNELVGTNNYLFLEISLNKKGKKETYYTASSVVQRQLTEFDKFPCHVELVAGSGRRGKWFALRLLS